MTTPTHSEATVQATTQSQDIGELSFTDYQRVRRGEIEASSVQPKSAPAPEKSVEQKQFENSDASETESEVEVDSDESEAETDEVEAKEKPKKKSGIQRRIDKLNAAKAAAQQEAEYWKREALKTATAPKHDAQESQKPEVEAKTAQVDGKPNPDSFDTYVEYVEALTEWKIEQRDKAKSADAEKSKLETDQKKAIEAYAAREKAFKEKTKDYDDVLEAVDDIVASPALVKELVESENSAELVYALAKDRAEFERINALPPQALARALGRLEAKIASQPSKASDEEKKPEPKKLTNAPKPIEPVGSGKGHVAKSIDDPNLSFAEYEKLRRDQMKRARG